MLSQRNKQPKDCIVFNCSYEMYRLSKPTEAEIRLRLPKASVGRSTQSGAEGCEVSFWGDENTLKVDCSDDCTTL